MKTFSERLERYARAALKGIPMEDALDVARDVEDDGGTPIAALKSMRAFRRSGGVKGIFGNLDLSLQILDKIRADLDAGKIPQYNYTKCGGRTPGAKNAKRTKMELMQRRENKLLKARIAELEARIAELEAKYENDK